MNSAASTPSPTGPADEPSSVMVLPLHLRHPIFGGMAAGVLLRLAFSGTAGSPWSAMAGTLVLMIEGRICVLGIFPLFAALGAVGG